MRFEEYLERLEEKFKRFFTIEKGITIGDTDIDFYAEYHNVVGRTFLTKFDVLDRYEVYEKCYLKHFDVCNKERIETYFKLIEKEARRLKPSNYHMSTDFAAVMVFNVFDPALAPFVRKVRYGQLYHYYFRGWSDIKLICVDLKTLNVYTNKYARNDKKTYRIKV